MSSWPELTALEVLVGVADHGSLSAAARAVHMAQPNASRSVSRLEQRLGLTLLRRATSGSTVTPEGLLLVEWARRVLSSADDLLRNARSLSASGSEELRVCASQTVAEHLLPGWLAAFQSAAPGVRVQLEITNTAAVIGELHAGHCDLGFIEGPVSVGSAHLAVVGSDSLVLVVAPGHPWANRSEPVSTSELVSQRLITREAGSGTRQVLDDALGTPVVPQVELGSNAAVRVAVLSGAGPAVLSTLAVGDAIASGALVAVPMTIPVPQRRLCAAWVGPKHLTGPAAELVRIAALAGRMYGNQIGEASNH